MHIANQGFKLGSQQPSLETIFEDHVAFARAPQFAAYSFQSTAKASNSLAERLTVGDQFLVKSLPSEPIFVSSHGQSPFFKAHVDKNPRLSPFSTYLMAQKAISAALHESAPAVQKLINPWTQIWMRDKYKVSNDQLKRQLQSEVSDLQKKHPYFIDVEKSSIAGKYNRKISGSFMRERLHFKATELKETASFTTADLQKNYPYFEIEKTKNSDGKRKIGSYDRFLIELMTFKEGVNELYRQADNRRYVTSAPDDLIEEAQRHQTQPLTKENIQTIFLNYIEYRMLRESLKP